MTDRPLLSRDACALLDPAWAPAVSPTADQERKPRWPRRLLRALAASRERWLQRQALADLDERLLKDIGVSQTVCDRECRRRPWDGRGAD